MKKRNFRKWSGLLAMLMAVVLLAADMAPLASAKVTQSDINKLKNESSALDKKQAEVEAKLKELAKDKKQVLNRRDLLDSQIANTAAQISNVESQIDNYNQLIAQSEAELADAEVREAEQSELFCRRVRVMEEQGTVSYWQVLFGATSFADMLSRLNDVNEIMEADQSVIDNLKELQVQIAATKAGLEENKAATEVAKTELETKKAALDSQRREAIALVQEIKDNEAEYKDAAAELKAEEERIQAEIVRLSRELAAQQAAAGQSQQTNPGGYIWPVDSRYITSTVGGRTSPGGVGSTNHKGTDIGRVGYNSAIYAAKAGTVIVSTYSRSYGNYVVVSHGSGNTTLYAHMSSRKVEVGQYVKQGAVLGITGSTGNSTGPHLHFEITENGVRINPLKHGAQPQKGYLTGYTLSGTGIST